MFFLRKALRRLLHWVGREEDGKDGVSAVLGPHAKLNRRTERVSRTVAANTIFALWT